MRTILLILFFVTSTLNIFPQIDTTRKEFYPLQRGNLWQYRNERNKLVIQQVVGDTILDGERYFLLIHSLRTSGGITRIDSLMRIQIRWGGTIGGDKCGGNTPYESSIYHLAETDSTVWEICETFNGMLAKPLVRFNTRFTQNIFGQPREVIQFDFGGASPDEDTIWNFGGMLAKGIGIIEEQYFEGEYFILQGAIIDGVQYGTIVSVDEIAETTTERIFLYQNYPNPFNPTTTVRYEISKTTNVKLKIINVLGEEVEILVDEIKYPGSYEIEFNASQLSSGVYIALLQTTEAQLTRSMLLIK